MFVWDLMLASKYNNWVSTTISLRHCFLKLPLVSVLQVFQVSKELSKYSHVEIALSVGGLDLTTQIAALKRIPDIVIATPGRLIDHTLNTPTFSLDSIEVSLVKVVDQIREE